MSTYTTVLTGVPFRSSIFRGVGAESRVLLHSLPQHVTTFPPINVGTGAGLCHRGDPALTHLSGPQPLLPSALTLGVARVWAHTGRPRIHPVLYEVSTAFRTSVLCLSPLTSLFKVFAVDIWGLNLADLSAEMREESRTCSGSRCGLFNQEPHGGRVWGLRPHTKPTASPGLCVQLAQRGLRAGPGQA